MPKLSERTTILLILLLALVVRISSLAIRHEYTPSQAIIGAEAGAMASSLATGQGFMSPFDNGISPSTHLPPLYPVLLAGLLKIQWLFIPSPDPLPGHFVFYAALIINLIAASLLPLVARRLAQAADFPAPVANLAAILLCFCPEALRAVGLIWDEALFTTLCAAWLLLIIQDAKAPRSWHPLRAGITAGLLSLLNPAFLLASLAAWIAMNFRRDPQKKTTENTEITEQKIDPKNKSEKDSVPSVLSVVKFPVALGILLTTLFLAQSPWHIRNWLSLDPPTPVFIRGNFWLEAWTNINLLQSTPDGKSLVPLHPWQGTDPLVRNGQPLTEQQYFDWCKERVLARPEFRQPLPFAIHLAQNILDFWTGLGEARRWHKSPALFFIAQGIPALLAFLGLFLSKKHLTPRIWWLFFAVLATFGLPYYVSGAAARYRHPIDALIFLLAAWSLWWIAQTFILRQNPAKPEY